ncbi:MAG: hypothetical protein WCK35_06355 [Chloroflexota bacterium]
MLRLYEDSGLANLLRNVRSAEGRYSNLRAFGVLERTCQMVSRLPETLMRAGFQIYKI